MEPHGDDSTFDEPLKQPKLEPNAPGKGIDLPESTMHAYDDQHSSDQIYMPEEPREEGSPERGPEQITPVQQRGGLPKLVLYGDVSVHPCKVESLDQTNVQQHDGPQELVLYGSVNVQPHEEKGLDQTQQPQEGDDICSLKQKHQDEDQQGREITSPDDEMLAEESDLLVPGLMEQPHREHQLNGPQQDSTLSEVHMIAHEGKQPFPGNVNTSYDQREHLLPSQSEQCLLSLSAQIPSGADTKLPLVENDIESSRKLYLRDQPEIDFLGGSSRSGTMIKSEEQKQYHFCYGSAAAEGSTGFLPNGHEAPDLTTTAQLPAAAPSHHHHTVVYARSDAIKMEDGGLEEVTLPYVGQTNWETGKLTRRPFEISSSSQNNIALASNAAVPIEGMTKKQLELLSLYANSLACASAGMGSAAPNTLGSFETVAAALKTINDLGGSEEVAAALKALQELQNSEDIGEIVETVDKPQRSDHDGTPATGPKPNPFAATAPEQKQAIFSDEAFFSSQSPIDGTHLGAAPGVSSGTVYVNESHQYASQQPTAYVDESQQHESQQPKADTTFSQFGDVSRESFSDPESQGAKECRIRAEILAHPTFPEMLAAHVACLRVTVPEDHMLNVPDQLIRSQELLRVYSAFVPPSDLEGPAGAQRKKDLDQFMRLYTDTLWDLRGQLERYVPKQVKETLMFIARVENEAKNLFASCQVLPEAGNNPPESDVNKSTQSQSAMEEYASAGEDYGPLVPTGSERTIMEGIRNQLKQQYGEEGYKSKILEVRDEILRKRRAGKLPTGTIAILKEWWNDHIDWPYPTEDDKERFMEETGLEIRQINNWFINQRKRNWNNGASSSKSNDRKNKQKQ